MLQRKMTASSALDKFYRNPVQNIKFYNSTHCRTFKNFIYLSNIYDLQFTIYIYINFFSCQHFKCNYVHYLVYDTFV